MGFYDFMTALLSTELVTGDKNISWPLKSSDIIYNASIIDQAILVQSY